MEAELCKQRKSANYMKLDRTAITFSNTNLIYRLRCSNTLRFILITDKKIIDKKDDYYSLSFICIRIINACALKQYFEVSEKISAKKSSIKILV